MNQAFYSALWATIVLCFFIACGYILRKTNAVPKNSATVFSSVLLNFFIPILILYVMTQNITPEIIYAKRTQLLTSFCVLISSCILAKLISRIMDKSGTKRGVFAFATAFPNFAFMGIPIAEAVYGPQSLPTLILFILPYYILVNVLGDIIIRDEKLPRISMIISPITIATALGFFLVYAKVSIPSLVIDNAKIIYQATTPFAMMLTGFVLASKKLTLMFTNLKTYFVTLLRLILFPLIVLIVLRLCGFSGISLGIPVLVSGMPTAVNGVMLAEHSGKDSFLCSSIIFISTLLSLITIPVLSYIVTMF